ncbi:MAG: hypothetical protein RhofKO_00020 [Rhodothermales bacterium]
MLRLASLLVCLVLVGCDFLIFNPGDEQPASYGPFDDAYYEAPLSTDTLKIDGIGDEAVWERVTWNPIRHLWLGDQPTAEDFSGRYKIAWDANTLYVLAEITDDVINDHFTNGLENYWRDDCLEIFIDEDASGGDHTYNHNAFAYHIALDGQAVDLDTFQRPRYYTDHIRMQRVQTGTTSVWEVAITVYSRRYRDTRDTNTPVDLGVGKTMGFAIAYCDNDGGDDREHFIGSVFIPGADKNVAWRDASVFGRLQLMP